MQGRQYQRGNQYSKILHISIFVFWKFFRRITDYHWLMNVKIFFISGIWKNIQLSISSASEIVQKFSRELKFERELIF